MLEPARCGGQEIAWHSEDVIPTLLKCFVCLTWHIRNVKKDASESQETLDAIAGPSNGHVHQDICNALFLFDVLSVIAACH
jgi:hypothetical protein